MKQLLCLGDSITDGGRLFSSSPQGDGYVALLSQALGGDWEVINRGTDGFTVQRVLEQMNREFGRYHPDVITLLVGINDVGLMKNTDRSPIQQTALAEKFSETYRRLLVLLRRYPSARILLMEPFLFPYPAEYQSWFPTVEDLSNRIRLLAFEFQTEFLPLWQPLLNMAQSQPPWAVTTDGIHLSDSGHHLLRDLLLEKLQMP